MEGRIGEHKGFLGSENILYDTVIVGTYHYTFVQTHRMYSTKYEP